MIKTTGDEELCAVSITWTYTAVSTHLIHGRPCSTVAVAATGCGIRSTMAMTLQKGLGL